MVQEVVLDQNYLPSSLQIANGENRRVSSLIHKFGKNTAVGTTFVPVSLGGDYLTPQVGSATTLRIAAGNTNDTAAGTGAREVTLEGLDANGDFVTEALATAGITASSTTTATFIRLFRAYVSASGTYGTASAGSHAADIVIENGAGGTTWATIDATDYPKSQTEIGLYSVPRNHSVFLTSAWGFTDTTKTTNLIFFQRTGILQTAAPYDAVRTVFEERLEGGEFTVEYASPVKFVGPCDVGFLAKVDTTTAEVDVDFELILVPD
jgi:hypothetical protein